MTLRLKGWRTPVAAPWITRAATTPSKVGANCPSRLASANTVAAIRKVLRGPRLCTNHALSSMLTVVADRNPVEIQCTRF